MQLITLTGLALLGVTLAGQASAGCSPLAKSADPLSKPDSSGKVEMGATALPAVFTRADATAGRLMLVHNNQGSHDSIVGLWKFEMLAKSTSANKNPMPDGALIDFGTAAWHDDGTELMNSGARKPADGDFCQGVWEQAGPNEFVLNHYALAYTDGAYTGPVNIRERVNLDRSGKKFTGVFVLTAYLATAVPGHEFDQTTPLVNITGTIKGTRVTVD
ncbi:MAG: hypothetical protein WDO68_06790 [Gammaproteobacteria bacterium]